MENHFNVDLVMLFINPVSVRVSNEVRRALSAAPIAPAFIGASTVQEADVCRYYDILPTLKTLNELLQYDEGMGKLLSSGWTGCGEENEAKEDVAFEGGADAVLVLRRECFEV